MNWLVLHLERNEILNLYGGFVGSSVGLFLLNQCQLFDSFIHWLLFVDSLVVTVCYVRRCHRSTGAVMLAGGPSSCICSNFFSTAWVETKRFWLYSRIGFGFRFTKSVTASRHRQRETTTIHTQGQEKRQEVKQRRRGKTRLLKRNRK